MTNAFQQIRLNNNNLTVSNGRLFLGSSGILFSGEASNLTSQNITNTVTGFGTANYLSKFTPDNSGLMNSNIVDSGNFIYSNVPVISSGFKSSINGLNIFPQINMFAYTNFR